MMRSLENWLFKLSAVAAVILVIVGGLWLWSRHKGNEPKIPKETQETIDSLRVTKPVFEHTQDSIRRVVVYDTVQATRAQAAAEKARASAKAQQHRADSLAVVAATAAVDSARAWHAAYDARTAEAEQLRTAFAEKDSAYRSERHARQALEVSYGADTTRRVAIEKVNKDLLKAIDRLEQPCRVLGPIPCPTRTVAAVGSGILGLIIGNQVKHVKVSAATVPSTYQNR